jgi:hypothetical protein
MIRRRSICKLPLSISYTPASPNVSGTTLFTLDPTGSLSRVGAQGVSPDPAGSGILTFVGPQRLSSGMVGYVEGAFAIAADPARGADVEYAVLNQVSVNPESSYWETVRLADGSADRGGTFTATADAGNNGLAVVPEWIILKPGGPSGSGTPTPTDITPSQRFVSQVFRSLLGQNPDQNSLTTLSSFLD